MSWRIVQISSNSKLELKLNYLVVRHDDEIRKVFIPEIAVLIIESTAVSLTASLLCELSKNKIKVIFCDGKRNPYGELLPYYGTCDSFDRLRTQISWKKTHKEAAWTEIIKEKISKQKDVLTRHGHIAESNLLQSYIDEILPYDESNREGHAAKVYFNALFGLAFSRREDSVINSALNYGYSVLLSLFNREISICGYNTQLGIYHQNTFNQFNLASDLMEPFRPLIDEHVLSLDIDRFTSEVKQSIVSLLNTIVYVGNQQNYLMNAIRIYVNSFFKAMESGNMEILKFYEVEIHENPGILRPSC